MTQLNKRGISEQLAEDLLTIHEEIIHGCLKSLRLYGHHPDYDDYVQIGRVALLQAYERFPQDLMTEQEIYQFTGYAYTRVRWKIIDEIRKVTRHSEKKAALTDEVIAYVTKKSSNVPHVSIEFTDLFKKLWEKLDNREREIVKALCQQELNYSEIAEVHNISRRTVYNIRKKIQEKWLAVIHSETENKGEAVNE